MTSTDRRYGVAEGLAVKAPCRAATTANVALAGLQTIDAVALAEGDRVLVRAQSNGAENGIYVASTGNWTRAADFDGARDIVSGTQVFVSEGGAFGSRMYAVATADPIVVGTTAISFTGVSTTLTTQSVATAADVATLPGDFDIVFLRSYWDATKSPHPSGGGPLYADPASNETIDNMVVFGRAAGGRYKRQVSTSLRASEAGLYDSTTDDQAARLQAFIALCMKNRWECVVDVGNINCAGKEIWVNPDCSAFSASAGTTFTMRGAARRSTEIRNVYITFGKFYRLVSGVPTYDITRDPSNAYKISNMTFRGCARFVNIEGCPSVEDCAFFASSLAGFYTNFPATWGIGDAVSETITTPYSSITHIVELLCCNHMQWINSSILEGSFYGNALSAALCSQMGNLAMIGGRINNCDRGLEFAAHPVYGNQVTENCRITGVHFEANAKEAVKFAGAQQVVLESHIRGSAGYWDRANYPLVRVETGSSFDIQINSTIVGIDSSLGVGISANSTQAIAIGGFFKRLKTAIKLESGVRGYRIENVAMSQVAFGTEYDIHDSARPYYTPPAVAANVSPYGLIKDTVALQDDFLGASLDANWLVSHGSDADCVDFAPASGPGGLIAGTTGDAGSGTMAINGIQVCWAELDFRADAGRLSAAVRLKVSENSGVCLFFGLTDQTGSLEMPFTYTGTTLTANATDAVGFVYDTSSTNDKWTMCGVDSGVGVSFESALNPLDDAYVELRIDIDATGLANFYIDGAVQGQNELVTNGGFVTDSGWTKDANWAIATTAADGGGGAIIFIEAAVHTPGAADAISQAISLVAGQTYTVRFRVFNRTAGSVTASFQGGTPVVGTARSQNLVFEQDFVAASGNTTLAFTASSTFDGAITDVSVTQKGLTGAVSPDVPLTVVVACFSTIVSQPRTVTIDYVSVQQGRSS